MTDRNQKSTAGLAKQVRLFRFWLFRPLMTLAMWVLPPSRYKTEMSAAHWTICLRVQAHSAATHHARVEQKRDRPSYWWPGYWLGLIQGAVTGAVVAGVIALVCWL